MKDITIKLLKIPRGVTGFSILDNLGNTIALDAPRNSLINGISYSVQDAVTSVTLTSIGDCVITKTVTLADIGTGYYSTIITKIIRTGCIWSHLTNNQMYNTYYGGIKPYIIEYPFAYKAQDETIQNVIDYTKSFKYLIKDYDSSVSGRIETNNTYFNKAILYNGQQSSGLLELVEKKANNLAAYSSYPKYNKESKTILFTKSDNFYQYNTFWALNVSSQQPLFVSACSTVGVDKFINQANMDYGARSFKKAPLRAKELKIRHILDNKSDIHLVSQFLYTPTQLSYK